MSIATFLRASGTWWSLVRTSSARSARQTAGMDAEIPSAFHALKDRHLAKVSMPIEDGALMPTENGARVGGSWRGSPSGRRPTA